MRSLINLWTAVATLAEALTGLAETISTANRGLRDRLQLDVQAEAPALIDATVTEPTTETKSRRTRS